MKIGQNGSSPPQTDPLAFAAAVARGLAREENLDRMLHCCAEAAVKHLGAAFARLWLTDPDEPVLHLLASAGIYTHTDGAHSRIPVGQYKIGQVAATRTPVHTNQVQQDPQISDHSWAAREGIVAFAGHPLIVEEQVVGVVGLFSRSPLEPETLQALASVADVIAVGVQRKRTEESLRRSEATLRSVFRSAPTGIGLVVDRVLTWTNERLSEITGYTAEEMSGQSARMLYPTQKDYDWVGEEKYRQISCTGSGTVETRWQRKDGQVIDVLLSSTPIDLDDWAAGVTFTALDITERKATERALKESEARLRSVVDRAPVVLWALNPAGVFTFSAGSGLATLGLGSGDVVGRTVTEVYGKEPGIVEDSRRALAGETFATVRSVGDHVFECQYVPLFDDEGTVAGTIGVALDVSERNRAEQERARLYAAVEQTAEEIVIADPAGRVRYVNPAFEAATGLAEVVVLGRDVSDLLGEGQGAGGSPGEILGTVREQGGWMGRISTQDREGKPREVEATISPIRGTDGAFIGTVAVRRDVTRQVRLEEQLRQAQKMEAVGQLAGGVAHDFNNLLQAIQGYAELSSLRPERTEQVRGNQEQILTAVERGSSLVKQLLAFSRREVLQLRPVDLRQAVTNLTGLLHRVLGEQVELVVTPGNPTALVLGDTGQLEQILMNLCVNARDAMPQGGTITLHTEDVTLDRDFCDRHPWADPGAYVALTVTDAGVGFSPEVARHIFEPFYTTKEVGQGTGLGLATVYAIVERHRGVIEVDSTPGRGTVFRLYFPACEGRPEEPVAAPPDSPAGSRLGTLLLAEDDELVRELAVQVLEQEGYQVLVARDGREAVEQFEAHREDVDLALLDVVMPRLSGRAVAERIHALRPGVPVLFCSGYSYDELEDHQLPDDGVDVLQKPYRGQVLLARIQRLLNPAAPD